MTDDEQGHRSAIVWSVPKADVAGWMSLSDEEFPGGASGDGRVPRQDFDLAAPRSTYPLGFRQAGARMIDHRLALVGDAAHADPSDCGPGLEPRLPERGCLG